MRQKRTVSNNFKLGQRAAAPRHRAAQRQKLRAAGNKPVRHGSDDIKASTRKKLPLLPTICALGERAFTHWRTGLKKRARILLSQMTRLLSGLCFPPSAFLAAQGDPRCRPSTFR